MPARQPDLDDDADLRFLLDSLDLLPDGGWNAEPDGFWTQYATAHGAGWDSHYYLDCLDPSRRRILAGHPLPGDQTHLAVCCLSFFNVENNPAACQLLDQTATTWLAQPQGAIGHRWADAVCHSAWRLYVRLEASAIRRRHPLITTNS